MSKKAIVLMADGFEEVEAVTPIDYLRRAGIDVTVVSISGAGEQKNLAVTGRWTGIKLICDISLSDLIKQGYDDFDAVICPGGMPGAANLASSKEVSALLKNMASAGKVICAICASPAIVLAPLGIIAGKKFTCYPGMEEKAVSNAEAAGAVWVCDRVVTDGNVITSRAAGTAGEWAAAIIKKLLGEEAGSKISETVLL